MSWILRGFKRLLAFIKWPLLRTRHGAIITTYVENSEPFFPIVGSRIPFQKYLTDMRRAAQLRSGRDRLTLREYRDLRKLALRNWSKLPPDAKSKYRDRAGTAHGKDAEVPTELHDVMAMQRGVRLQVEVQVHEEPVVIVELANVQLDKRANQSDEPMARTMTNLIVKKQTESARKRNQRNSSVDEEIISVDHTIYEFSVNNNNNVVISAVSPTSQGEGGGGGDENDIIQPQSILDELASSSRSARIKTSIVKATTSSGEPDAQTSQVPAKVKYGPGYSWIRLFRMAKRRSRCISRIIENNVADSNDDIIEVLS